MLLDQVAIKSVVARRHRRVSGENCFSRNARNSFVETQALILHSVSNCFQHRKPAVAFIQVQHTGRDSHRLQRAESTHSQQQLLADSNSRISAV